MAPTMSTPPMVGVPFFRRWRSGSVLANRLAAVLRRAQPPHQPGADDQRDDEGRDERHEGPEGQVAEDVEQDVVAGQWDEEVVEHRGPLTPSRARPEEQPRHQRVHHPLQPHAARGLHEHHVAGREALEQMGHRVLERAARARLGESAARAASDGQPRSRADSRRARPRPGRPPGDPPRGGPRRRRSPSSSMSPSTTTSRPRPSTRGDRLQGRPHRDRVGVVGVVEDANAVRLSPHTTSLDRHGRRRGPVRSRPRRQPEARRPVAAAARALVTLWRPTRARRTAARSPSCSTVNPMRPRRPRRPREATCTSAFGVVPKVTTRARVSRGHAEHARVVGIEHGHARGRQGADERSLLLAHPLDASRETRCGPRRPRWSPPRPSARRARSGSRSRRADSCRSLPRPPRARSRAAAASAATPTDC